MNTVHIRKGVRRDVPAIYSLVKELAEYENAGNQLETTIEQMEADAFGKRPLFEFFVAETPVGEIVGAALFYFGYSSWKGKKLYLDDLIVTGEYRRKGIGEKLLDHLVGHALENDVQQIRWHVLEWNKPAISFYEKVGVEFDDEWIMCKMGRDKMRAHYSTLMQQSLSN